MLRKILLATAFAAVSTPAFAHDWYQINNDTAQCGTMEQFSQSLGVPWVTNPYEAKAFFEKGGDVVYVKEGTLTESQAYAVQLTVTTSVGATPTFFYYFPTLADCQKDLQAEIADGTLVNPNDLK